MRIRIGEIVAEGRAGRKGPFAGRGSSLDDVSSNPQFRRLWRASLRPRRSAQTSEVSCRAGAGEREAADGRAGEGARGRGPLRL